MKSCLKQLSCLTLVAVAGLMSSAVRAEDTPNPEYAGWAACKPGATVKVAGTTEAMGQKTSQTITTKLLELTPEKAVVETSVSISLMGQKMDQPAVKRTILAAAAAPKMPAGAAKKPDVKTGEDTVLVNGKPVKCTTSETETDARGVKTDATVWNSPDVPGGLVKMVAKTSGAMTSTTTMELVEFTNGR